ncbi:MAG TPA: carbohydrate binding family 9 domain-containing protein [Nitrospiria bacterium]|nr:carbohydrate binding family 9 domain-containing protein [Nitrospiria bacterium]
MPAVWLTRPAAGVAAWGLILLATSSVASAAEPVKPTLAAFPLADARVVVDGVLDESVWRTVPGMSGLIQQTPRTGEPAVGVTTVWVAYDAQALYVAARLDDPQPELIQADERHRDAAMARSDTFDVVIDTYHDHQNAFLFQTNPLGAQYDAALTREGAFVNDAWNGIWEVAAGRTPTGWAAEFRIPFTTLRYHSSAGATWGIQFRRVIPHLMETSYWSPLAPEQSLYEISRGGHLVGVAPLHPRRRLTLMPYAKGAYGVRSDDDAGWHVDHDAGGDARVAITPDLTLDLTLNTDFAETEADHFQVRLDRFPLFFPERREFFLEDKGAFEFGLEGQVQPFFSRTIGLSGGEPVPLWGGAKLTGKADRYGIGALTMQSRARDNDPAERFSVLRLTRDLGLRSQVGVIGTRREVLGGPPYQTVGADASYNPTSELTTNAFWMRSDGPQAAQPGYAGYAQAQYRDPFWRLRLYHLRVDERFDPQLGFVKQNDLAETYGYVDVRPRPATGPVLEWGVKTELTYQSTTDGTMLYRSQYQRVLAEFRTGDTILVSWDPQIERLQDSFELKPGIVIPAGEYRYHHWNVYVASEPSRPFSGYVSVLWGGYYGGRKTSLDVNLTASAFETVKLGAGLSVDWIRVPTGVAPYHADTVPRVLTGDVQWSVTNRLVLKGLVQHEHESGTLASYLRLAWEYHPGSFVYLIANPSSSRETGSAAVYLIKVTWRWEAA